MSITKPKTSLEDFLLSHQISTYRITQLMGEDPGKSWGKWTKKIRGESIMKKDELDQLKLALQQEIGRKISDADFDIQVEEVRVI